MRKDPGTTINRDRLLALFLLSAACIAVFANLQGFSAMLPLVQDEFLVSRAQVGLYTSFYFFSSVLVAVFSGRIADKLGTKRGLVLGVGVIAVMMVLHSLSPFFGLILALAFITGFAYSLITPSINKGVIELSEPQTRSMTMGLVYGGGGLGGFLGAVLLPHFGAMAGWRTALLCSSVFAIFVALLVLKFYQPQLVGGTRQNEPAGQKAGSLKEDLKYLLKNRYLVCILTMGIVFGMSISSVTGHFSIYLTRDLGAGPVFAGMGLGVFHVGGIIGQPLCGLINEKLFGIDRRKGLSLFGLIISGLILYFGLVVSRLYLPPYAILISSFLLGFFTLGIIAVYFTAVSELVSTKHIGVITGLALIFPRISTVITPPLFGLAADITGYYTLSWILLGGVLLIITLGFVYFSGKYIKIVPAGLRNDQ